MGSEIYDITTCNSVYYRSLFFYYIHKYIQFINQITRINESTLEILLASFQKQVVNTIKLYFKKIESRKLDIEAIKTPSREKRLPNESSKQEGERLLKVASVKIKHQSAPSLIYSCGLRQGELIN